MASRRIRLIIKACLRGYITTAYPKFGIRSLARTETILSYLLAEEDAQVALNSARFYTQAYGPLLKNSDKSNEFLQKQAGIFRFSQERAQFKPVSLEKFVSTSLIQNDSITKRLISDFNYMLKHGIVDLMRDRVMAHRRKHGIKD